MAMRNGVQLLAGDIWDSPDDGNRYEVIDGELYVSPPPTYAHQNIVPSWQCCCGSTLNITAWVML
jgi:hypothetical protein